jgi:hypothetical protein
VAWTSFFREVCGLELEGDLWERGRAYEQTAESACWWWPHKDFVIVSERPAVIHREQVGPRGVGSHRLHCEDGPAIAFPDGWAIYAYHGVVVPEKVIMHPEDITAEELLAEENAEVRRVMIERMGFERFCSRAKMKVIHTDRLESNFPSLPVSEVVAPGDRLVTSFRPGVEIAELLESEEFRDFEERPLRFARLTDPSTERQYLLRTEHRHARCYEAIGASFGMTEREYKEWVVQHS